MPIPIVLIGIGATTAAVGIVKGAKAVCDNNTANNINASAESVVNTAKEAIENARKKSGESLEALGTKKLFVLDVSIARFISTFEKLKNVQLEESIGLDELKKFRIDKQSLDELKEMSGFASSVLGGIMSGTLGGALTAFGAYGAASMFAMASTGIPIATLSGAAATNATLAFLGGGALAVGGLGMAGGAVVLGGIVAGPALAILGIIMEAKASENLDNAWSNMAQAQKLAEELRTGASACNAIRRRAFLFLRLLIRLECVFMRLVMAMEETVRVKGENYSDFTAEEKHTVAAAVTLAAAIKSALDTPILTEKGELTSESEKVASTLKRLFDMEGQTKPVGDTNNEVVFCVNCGKKHSSEVVFCTECGKKLKNL
jgi:hypothetical protein